MMKTKIEKLDRINTKLADILQKEELVIIKGGTVPPDNTNLVCSGCLNSGCNIGCKAK